MIPPLFLQPPADKSFSFIAQTQGLQVHRPQKEGGGGCMERWDGKENGQSGDKRGRNRTPYPVLTSKPTHPSPHPASMPVLLLPCNTSRFCSAAFPLVRRVQTEWCRLALPGLAGYVWQGTEGRHGNLAMWWEQPFTSKASKATIDSSHLVLQWPMSDCCCWWPL